MTAYAFRGFPCAAGGLPDLLRVLLVHKVRLRQRLPRGLLDLLRGRHCLQFWRLVRDGYQIRQHGANAGDICGRLLPVLGGNVELIKALPRLFQAGIFVVVVVGVEACNRHAMGDFVGQGGGHDVGADGGPDKIQVKIQSKIRDRYVLFHGTGLLLSRSRRAGSGPGAGRRAPPLRMSYYTILARICKYLRRQGDTNGCECCTK